MSGVNLKNSLTKKNLILDLDNTLISAIGLDEIKWDKQDKKKALNFDTTNMKDYYVIFHRPHLQRFLNYIFKKYNVSIWSAGSKDYVLFIVKNIILKNHPERKIDYIFFSYHCKLSRKYFDRKSPKNLKLLWDIFKLKNYNKNNTMIIDDLEEVHKAQPKNCIKIEDFTFTNDKSEDDKDLLRVVKLLKEKF
jgi:hypothetical protein